MYCAWYDGQHTDTQLVQNKLHLGHGWISIGAQQGTILPLLHMFALLCRPAYSSLFTTLANKVTHKKSFSSWAPFYYIFLSNELTVLPIYVCVTVKWAMRKEKERSSTKERIVSKLGSRRITFAVVFRKWYDLDKEEEEGAKVTYFTRPVLVIPRRVVISTTDTVLHETYNMKCSIGIFHLSP